MRATDPRSLSHEVHLWHVAPEAVGDPMLIESCRAIVTPEEHDRTRRFVFERHRHQHLVTRALVRTVLSSYAPDVPPQAWEFSCNSFGRPEIAAPSAYQSLMFNLSHTDGLVVCLISANRELGVDVEDTSRQGQTVEIADRYFSATEVSALRALPPSRQRDRFFDYWTLKESYIKARGLGLHLPLDQFSFHLPVNARTDVPADPIRISFEPEIDDDPHTWQFMSFRFTQRHQLAVAIRRIGPDLALRTREWAPRG